MKGNNFPIIDFNRLAFPPADLKIVRRNGVFKVYDPLRKNYFVLTEEEFVRQCFVNWLIRDLGYPPSLMGNEIGIKLNNTYKRCDTVVYRSEGNPLMIIEFKAPGVAISQNVFNQIIRYNMSLKADFLVVSNGYQIYCCKINYKDNSIEFLSEIPLYINIV